MDIGPAGSSAGPALDARAFLVLIPKVYVGPISTSINYGADGSEGYMERLYITDGSHWTYTDYTGKPAFRCNLYGRSCINMDYHDYRLDKSRVKF